MNIIINDFNNYTRISFFIEAEMYTKKPIVKLDKINKSITITIEIV